MSETEKLQLRFDELTTGFVLPLITGQTIQLERPIAPGAIHYFAHASSSTAGTNEEIFDALHRAASAIAPLRTVPWPDRDLLLIAMAAYDLVCVTDPALDRAFARGGRRRVLAWIDEIIDAIGPPTTRANALARQALLDPLSAVRRKDIVAKSWAYTYRFIGRRIGSRLLSRPVFGKFDESAQLTDVTVLFSDLDRDADLGLMRRFRQLLARSPVTELLRLDLCEDFRFGLATLAVLSDDAIRSGVAREIVERGEWKAAPRLGRALGEPVLRDAPPAHLYYALALCFDTQLTATLDVPGPALPKRLDFSDPNTARYAAVVPAFFSDPSMHDEIEALSEEDRAELEQRCSLLAKALPPAALEEVAPLVARCARPTTTARVEDLEMTA